MAQKKLESVFHKKKVMLFYLFLSFTKTKPNKQGNYPRIIHFPPVHSERPVRKLANALGDSSSKGEGSSYIFLTKSDLNEYSNKRFLKKFNLIQRYSKQ